MRSLAKLLQKLLTLFSSACLVSLFFILLWQVFSRYVLKNPSTFTEELSRMLLVAMTLTGASLGFMQSKHLSLDLLLQKSSAKTKKNLMEFILVSQVILGIILLSGGLILLKEKWELGQISSVLGIKLVYYYLLLPFCGLSIMLAPFNEVEKTCN